MANKIAIITRENSIASVMLNKIIPNIVNMGYTPVLFITTAPKIKGMEIAELKEAAFIETTLYKDVVIPYLNNHPLISNKQPLKGVNYTISQLSEIYNIEVSDLKNVNSNDFVEYITNNTDIVGGINVRGLNIFKEPLINAFQEKEHGFFWNVHPGILPKYKGLYIPFRAALNNETLVGQTLYHIDAGIDEGEMIAIQSINFNDQKPVFETYLDLAHVGAALIKFGLEHYDIHGNPKGVKQSKKEKQQYSPLPTSKEMQLLAKNGTVFAKKEDIARIYIKYFSKVGITHAAGLTDKINKALVNMAQSTDHPYEKATNKLLYKQA